MMNEVSVISLTLASLLIVLLKWKKVLVRVVVLEMASLLAIGRFFLKLGGVGFPIILVFAFLVVEALIILAALYGSLQVSGKGQGLLNLL